MRVFADVRATIKYYIHINKSQRHFDPLYGSSLVRNQKKNELSVANWILLLLLVDNSFLHDVYTIMSKAKTKELSTV